MTLNSKPITTRLFLPNDRKPWKPPPQISTPISKQVSTFMQSKLADCLDRSKFSLISDDTSYRDITIDDLGSCADNINFQPIQKYRTDILNTDRSWLDTSLAPRASTPKSNILNHKLVELRNKSDIQESLDTPVSYHTRSRTKIGLPDEHRNSTPTKNLAGDNHNTSYDYQRNYKANRQNF